MVKLTEVEDEHFKEKPTSTKSDALLLSDDEDEDYTDTGMLFSSFIPLSIVMISYGADIQCIAKTTSQRSICL